MQTTTELNAEEFQIAYATDQYGDDFHVVPAGKVWAEDGAVKAEFQINDTTWTSEDIICAVIHDRMGDDEIRDILSVMRAQVIMQRWREEAEAEEEAEAGSPS